MVKYKCIIFLLIFFSQIIFSEEKSKNLVILSFVGKNIDKEYGMSISNYFLHYINSDKFKILEISRLPEILKEKFQQKSQLVMANKFIWDKNEKDYEIDYVLVIEILKKENFYEVFYRIVNAKNFKIVEKYKGFLKANNYDELVNKIEMSLFEKGLKNQNLQNITKKKLSVVIAKDIINKQIKENQTYKIAVLPFPSKNKEINERIMLYMDNVYGELLSELQDNEEFETISRKKFLTLITKENLNVNKFYQYEKPHKILAKIGLNAIVIWRPIKYDTHKLNNNSYQLSYEIITENEKIPGKEYIVICTENIKPKKNDSFDIDFLVKNKDKEYIVKEKKYIDNDNSIYKGGYYVEIKEGDIYNIKLKNKTNNRVAVALLIDGADCFLWENKKGYFASPQKASKWMIEAKSEYIVKGWQIDREKANAFVISKRSYASSELNLNCKLGEVTAYFYKEITKNEYDDIIARKTIKNTVGTSTGYEIESSIKKIEKMYIDMKPIAILRIYYRTKEEIGNIRIK